MKAMEVYVVSPNPIDLGGILTQGKKRVKALGEKESEDLKKKLQEVKLAEVIQTVIASAKKGIEKNAKLQIEWTGSVNLGIKGETNALVFKVGGNVEGSQMLKVSVTVDI